MRRRMWAPGLFGLLGMGLVACSMEVDVSELSFSGSDVVSQGEVPSFGPIECNSYVHCLLGLEEAPGEVDACLASVSGAGRQQADQLEACREEQCGALPTPGDAVKAGAMLECLFANCTERMVSCVAGRGESTCLSYAVKWQSQEVGTVQCVLNPPEICLVDYLVSVKPSEHNSVVDLIRCIVEIPEGAVEKLPACLALCD